MDRDTSIGGRQGRFPDTRRSAIVLARSDDASVRRQAHDVIIAAYWKPVYKYLRLRRNLSNENAKDLTQGFFALAIEKGFFDSYEPGKGSFRTFLRTCVDAFAANRHKHDGRGIRGGEAALLPLDFHVEATEQDLDELFHQEWVRNVFNLAIEDVRIALESRDKEIAFRVFQSYDLCDHDTRPTYAELAHRFGITAITLTNYLASARRDFRKAVLNKLRELTVSEREFKSEVRAVLGIEV